MNPDESSLEFDMFEDMRRTLTRVLAEEGHDITEAERIAFYVVSGIRDMPKLLNALAGADASDEEIRLLLSNFLSNVPPLEKARVIFFKLDDKILE